MADNMGTTDILRATTLRIDPHSGRMRSNWWDYDLNLSAQDYLTDDLRPERSLTMPNKSIVSFKMAWHISV